jgi:hypothetical protein
VQLWNVISGLQAGHAIALFIDGQWLRGYISLGLAIGVQIVRAIDDLPRR